VILDANERIGDSWRRRWDSLRLFTPARYDGLPGWRFPAPGWSFPTKDEMAEYLEAYATRFELPVRTGVRVERLSRDGDRFVVDAGDRRYEADRVVVASGAHRSPRTPAFASELDPEIVQLHSSEYRGPSPLRDGGVLVVGAGNSGAEIASELARSRPTWLAGRSVGEIPVRHGSVAARFFLPVVRFLGHRVLTVRTPIGRKVGPKLAWGATPLIRVKSKDFAAAGIERVPRIVGVRGGLPLLEDGRAIGVPNVVWCTGFSPGLLVDRPPRPRRERAAGARSRNRAFRPRPVLRRAALSLLRHVGRAPRRRQGRQARREARRARRGDRPAKHTGRASRTDVT
jgi:putative flavoprotein involved in K+ transport